MLRGQAPVCFILGIAGAYGLAKNVKVSRAVKEAEAKATHENIVDVFS